MTSNQHADRHKPAVTDEANKRPSKASTGRSPSSVSTSSAVLMVGPNFRVGKKIGCGNFGELRLGVYCRILIVIICISCYLRALFLENM